MIFLMVGHIESGALKDYGHRGKKAAGITLALRAGGYSVFTKMLSHLKSE